MTTTATKGKPPRGIRNNNPGNIEKGAKWQGLVPESDETDPRFAEFKDATWGIRALATILITYQDKYKINTIRGVINRWAPDNENDVDMYVSAVCVQSGLGPNQKLDMQNYDHLMPLVQAIIRHECGKGPKNTPNTWYTQSVIDTGLQRAGVVKESVTVASVPVTKETVGATGTGAIGVAQAVDVAPHVITAVESQQEQLSSGEIMKMVIAVCMIGLAVFIAYSQVKKHQAGVVA